MASLLVVAVAVFFFAMGAVALGRPEQVVRYFGTHVLSVDGRNEVRAVYGGFGIAVGALLLISLGTPTLRAGMLASVAVALLGMAGGRLASRAIDGAAGFYPWLFFGVEMALAAMLLGALGLAS
jgi:hypothetical protein